MLELYPIMSSFTFISPPYVNILPRYSHFQDDMYPYRVYKYLEIFEFTNAHMQQKRVR